jgi:hypothetical protein
MVPDMPVKDISDIPIKGIPEFRILKEDWSRYEIYEGKAIIWARVVLIKVLEIDSTKLPAGIAPKRKKDKPLYTLATQPIVTSFFDKELKKKPSNEPIDPEILETEEGAEPVEFNPIEEPWNEYLLPGAEPYLVKTKCVVTSACIFQQLINAFGEPTIKVKTQTITTEPTKAPIDKIP